MQLIFQGVPLAAASAFPFHPRFAEFIQRDEVRHIGTYFLILIAFGQLAQIFALWGASRVVVGNDHCTLGNSLKVWLLNLLLWVVVLGGVAMGISTIMHLEPWRILLIIGGTMMMWLLLVFLIPMKIYVTGFIRALGVLFLAGCINGGATTALEVVLMPAMHLQKDIASLQTVAGKTPAEQQSFMERLMGKEAPDEIDRLLDDALHPIGPQPALADREAALRNIQQKLTARQRSLKPTDTPALTAYQNQINRYLRLRNELITARSAPPASPAH